MLEWLVESWIVRILFFIIVYYSANCQIDRATRKADSAEYRARKAERELEIVLSDIRINANECIELRKRVKYLEEKMDEYARVLEALSVPLPPSMSMEDVSERAIDRAPRNSGVEGRSSVGSGGHVGFSQPGAQGRVENVPTSQQHLQCYLIKPNDPVKERAERCSTSSDQSSSSAAEKIASLREKLESGRDSVMSALSNIPRRRSTRTSRSGGFSASSIYSAVPGRTFARMTKRSRSKQDVVISRSGQALMEAVIIKRPPLTWIE
ncbi:hypothetical protein PRK78_005999 [Emydomyces testavorans]|uniref:Uncharacterized protein n=1 Tax=Emydomyces testavorans TaxID=2070801 RepID=A0AAF0DKW7_9EURO|nr:hypothetical protein PRK78_005999 [Emydomyces testavorans]